MEPTITKSSCEVYKIRNLPGSAWANITIDAADEYGRLQIASDYGDWQHFWSHCGGPFKKFLPKLEIGYVAMKFRADERFDIDRAVQHYNRDIRNARRGGEIDKETARSMWKTVESAEMNGDFQAFFAEVLRDHDLCAFYDGMPPHYTMIDPLFRRFWDEAWPIFLAEIAKETSPESVTV